MTIRENLEQWEADYLSKYAALSKNSKGRDIEEVACDIRPVYQRDRDRILHCKSFRRLKQKTQVFLSPEGDHYRTRLTHTLEVSQTARTIAKALRLNEELVEAIALGHDLGHTPFGHAGEAALDSVCSHGFKHYEQSIRIVEKLEKGGRGLNLTVEVRDGILNHGTAGNPSTLEGKVVRLADKIAYINHDIDDAIRGRILTEDDLPLEYRKILGFSVRERLNTIIHDIVKNSEGKPDIIMSDKVGEAMRELRAFMFANVYKNPEAKGEETKAKAMLVALFEHYMKHNEDMSQEYIDMIEKKNEDIERVVCDYIAGMTDQYAMSKFAQYFMPKSWNVY
ncbi:deoxyguanosinetriphosphate triphosphohydrolase [Konateibacter massiliensis]|uniref:deoxyguanosinetriphosphate triphosphohydrolase n=1 Tax=Konateibacter massiliensis TaxID=2002841 RepID=UPI000C15B588|nr:deoxyguanosinetriphosphate triphosphohydrolase [Konateibacter massiliensis]